MALTPTGSSTPGQSPTQLTGELSATVGAAYEAFLKARLERRHGRRGKVHARAFVNFIEMANEMLTGADVSGNQADAVWLMAIAELDGDRHEIEADVLAYHGFVVVEHEWAAFVEWVRQVRAPASRR